MLYAERFRIGGFEIIQERAAEGIGDLQGGAKHQRKNKEQRHVLFSEQDKRVKSKGRGQGFLARLIKERGRGGYRECITSKKNPRPGCLIKLIGALGPSQKVYRPHRDNKTHGSPDPDRRKGFNHIILTSGENVITYRVG